MAWQTSGEIVPQKTRLCRGRDSSHSGEKSPEVSGEGAGVS